MAPGLPLPTWLLCTTSSNDIVVGAGDSFSREAITSSAVAAPSLAVETDHAGLNHRVIAVRADQSRGLPSLPCRESQSRWVMMDVPVKGAS